MTTDLSTLAADLAEARADLALRERLDAAPARVKALVAEFDAARAAQAKADEAAAKEASEARFKGLSDIRVIEEGDAGLLHRIFTVKWMAPKYDMYEGKSFPGEHSENGFSALAENVLSFLIEKHPERIPASIMALAPGNPSRAMEEYFRARRRGYLKGRSAA